MKEKILFTGKNLNDVFYLPCVRAITKTFHQKLRLKVRAAPNSYVFADQGDWLVCDDDYNWSVEKGGLK